MAQRIGEIRAVRRMTVLIFDQLLLYSERHALAILIETRDIRTQARGAKLAGIKRIACQQRSQKGFQFAELVRFEGAAIGETGRCQCATTNGLPCASGSGTFANFATAEKSGSKSRDRFPMRQSVTSPWRSGYSFTNLRKLN